jgi:hypothetical protein
MASSAVNGWGAWPRRSILRRNEVLASGRVCGGFRSQALLKAYVQSLSRADVGLIYGKSVWRRRRVKVCKDSWNFDARPTVG